jgi:hypothetical protein
MIFDPDRGSEYNSQAFESACRRRSRSAADGASA